MNWPAIAIWLPIMAILWLIAGMAVVAASDPYAPMCRAAKFAALGVLPVVILIWLIDKAWCWLFVAKKA